MKFGTAKESYNTVEGAKNRSDFLNSEDGQFYKQILSEVFLDRLGENKTQKILDAGCGNGWLTALLSNNYPNIEGVDGSAPFLEEARNQYPDLKFSEVDLNTTLSYDTNLFDTVIMNMSAGDVEEQSKTFSEMFRILKPEGRILITIPSPYFSYPVMKWKRSFLGKLFGFKPHPQLQPYNWFNSENRTYNFNKSLQTNFYKLSEYLNNLHNAGFRFEFMYELASPQDSNKYDMRYRLHRFPIILYLEFSKPA